MTSTPPSTPAQRPMRVGPLILLAVLYGLQFQFWLTADFGDFTPASEGTTIERWFFLCRSLGGPAALALLNAGNDGLEPEMAGNVAAFLLHLVLVFVALRKRWSGLVVYGFVLFWFFAGFCVSSLRIT